MSTRATYRFEKKETRSSGYPPLTLYIHHDGYPSGAAYYFWQAHHHENQRGGMATAFIRANDGAELTASHQQHGDTEFRYTFADGVLKAEKRYYDNFDNKQWRTIFEGPYWQFINANPEQIEGFTPIREVGATPYRPAMRVSRQQLEKQLTDARAHRDSYYARFPGPSGNGSSNDENVTRLEKALADYNANPYADNATAQAVQQ